LEYGFCSHGKKQHKFLQNHYHLWDFDGCLPADDQWTVAALFFGANWQDLDAKLFTAN
jgi:hypothetical protein